MLDLEGVDQRAANTETRHDADPSQHLARQAGYSGRLRPQAHAGDRLTDERQRAVFTFRIRPDIAVRRPNFFPSRATFVAHDAGLPSVRDIRTRC